MNGNSVFDNLSALLSVQERKDLLEKLSSSQGEEREINEPIAAAPLKDVDVAEAYAAAGLLVKILLFFKSVFTGKDAILLFEERLLQGIWKELERGYPGLVSRENYGLLPLFFDEIDSLKKKARVFENAVEEAIIRNKPDFLAFLGGQVLTYTQEKLLAVTDIRGLPSLAKNVSDRELREKAEFKLEEIFFDISKEDRGRMGRSSNALNLLKEFVFFRFDSLSDVTSSNKKSAVKEKTERLSLLADLLFGLNGVFDRQTLENLFIFSFRTEMEEGGEEVYEKLSRQVGKAVRGLNEICGFLRSIPLVPILKLIRNDINYKPTPAVSGEEWFTLYKQFWGRRLAKTLEIFFAERKQKALYKDALAFVKLTALPKLSWYNGKTNEYGLTFAFEDTISLILAFLDQVFQRDMNAGFKLLLIDGQFYKDQNRVEFTDAYNGLLRIRERITKLDFSVSPEGNAGKALAQGDREFASAALKAKRFGGIVSSLEKDALGIIEETLNLCDSLMKILYGILFGEVGGKYDTLSNRVHLGGRENKAVLKSFADILEKLGAFIDMLKNFKDLEKKTK